MEASGRPRVGLALAGGVIRAPIHIGALTAFREAGIPVDYIAGTSFGGLVGAVYACGRSVEQMRDMVRHMRWSTAIRFTWPRLGLLSMDKLEGFLARELGDLTFADLHIPLAVVATNIVTGQQVVLQAGRLARAVCASCTLPGLFNPVEMDGQLLVDGSLANNLPISVVRKMGADFVIALDARARASHRPTNPFSAFLSSLSAMVRNAADKPEEADVYICPEVERTGGIRMPRPEPLIELGRQAALSALPGIRAALHIGEAGLAAE